MFKPLLLGTLLTVSISHVLAAQEAPAVLAGHAILPVTATVATPSDAPSDMQISGKYTTDKRLDRLKSLEGTSNGRPTGQAIPIKGQSLQGHSGIKKMADGSYWVLTDNGFGNKMNSPDAMLYLTQYDINFKNGQVKALKTIFLHDPDKKVPFHIVNESSSKRYLSGRDFDPESFQFTDDALWIGDEFGPYLIKADKSGKVLAVFNTEVDGKVVQSPDNHHLQSIGNADGSANFAVNRSKGFEGMALSKDGKMLYPLLEGALWDSKTKQYENIAGKRYLRVLEFDTHKNQWTGRSWQYVLEANHHAIGDFNMIDQNHGLIIERDNGEGTTDKACKANEDKKHCFDSTNLATFKRVYNVRFDDSNVGQTVDKVAYIDLMNIQDPKKLARKPLNNGVFTFPFFTIENVDVVDENHIIIGNDNNYPFSSSRHPNQADDNEFILLNVPKLLRP